MNTYEQWRDIVTGGNTLLPWDEWHARTNLYRLWESRINASDPRRIDCGDPHTFVRKVYEWLDQHLDAFLLAVYESNFVDRGWRDFDVVTQYDENSISNTPNNPGYFRNWCTDDIVECGGDGDRSLAIRDSIIRTLHGEVRKTFTMPAIWDDIKNGTVSSKMVLTFNKSCKLASVFSPNVYRYLLHRMQTHQRGTSVLFGTASWGVPVVAAEDCGYNTVGIVDVQDGVLDACDQIHVNRMCRYTLQTYHTRSEVMDDMIAPGWDHIISCPPYWDLEVYGGSPLQSTTLFDTYDAWLEGYWRPTVLASINLLTSNGIFAFIMGRYVRYQWCARDMTKIATECGLQLIDTVRIMPKRKTSKLYATSTEKWEECLYFKRINNE